MDMAEAAGSGEGGSGGGGVLGVEWSSPAAAGCMAAVALTVVAEPLFGRYDLTCLAKTTASTCFLWTALVALNADRVLENEGQGGHLHPHHLPHGLVVDWSAWSPFGRTVFCALVLGWIGDVCLLREGKVGFLAGLVSFLLGHLAFIAAFVLFGGDAPFDLDWSWCLGVGTVIAALTFVVYKFLRPYLKPDMVGPVLAYMFVFWSMVTSAGGLYGGRGIHTKHFNIFIGSLLFWASDLAVARSAFVKKGIENPAVGLPLYYAAQLVMASNVL